MPAAPTPRSTTSTPTGRSTARRTNFVGGICRGRRLQHPAADRLPSGAVRHAAMGQRMEAGDREMVPDRDGHQCQRQRHGQPLQLLRPRSDLSQRVRSAVDAHDLRLQGQRAQDGRACGGDHQRHRQIDEPDQAQSGCQLAPTPGPWCLTRARTTPAAPSWAPIRARARSTNICRAGIATTCSWSAPTCSRTIRPTIPPARSGALAYWTADAIKNRYLKNPGPLVQA